jgi:recombinational DNA repair ATPase RecF
MKLHSLAIENFRAIKNLNLDFTDELSKPRLMTLIVGPNSSGKTSIFDAIDTVIKTSEDKKRFQLREGLTLTAQQIVRGRGQKAKIEFEYSFDKDEAEAVIEIYTKMEIEWFLRRLQLGNNLPTKESVRVIWSFPSINSVDVFDISCNRQNPINAIGARGMAKQAVTKNFFTASVFNKIGGVCYLDQRRSLRLASSFNNENKETSVEHGDVLTWLYHFYKRHLTWNKEKYGESYWEKVQRLFNKICYPSELIGLESGPDSDTLILRKGGFDYDLYQMSSGEHQILRILVGLASSTAKNSIVLIDEIELNLHPTWQKRLIKALRDDTDNNQYIFTTHSPDVIDLFYESEIIRLGRLSE